MDEGFDFEEDMESGVCSGCDEPLELCLCGDDDEEEFDDFEDDEDDEFDDDQED